MPAFEAEPDDERPLEIELVPQLLKADVTERLSRSIGRCSSLRAAIAFWTIDLALLDQRLTQGLKDPGFLCVDINSPTDLDRLDQLAGNGASVFLHLKSPNNQMEDTPAGNSSMPKHLMHAKFLLFDFPDESAEIWVGSHNWTRRSLLGPNVELSMILSVRRGTKLYGEAEDNLAMIQSFCVPFDRDDLDYYKFLQRSERAETVPVIELEGNHVDSLAETSIELFGTDRKDLSELDSTGRKVIVSITESLSNPEVTYLYVGQIIQSGLLVRANPLADGIQFSDRRYAFRRGRRYPELVQSSCPDQILSQAVYFVTIEIESNITSRADVVDLPDPTRRWKQSPDDPLLRRMEAKVREQTADRKVVVRVPANGVSRKDMREETNEPFRLSIEEKRASTDAKLVAKRILVDRERNPISIEEAERS
ncbi:hypothetical protein AB1L88_16655 [Tautonia sp. JC769]|uniref:hypothetical protein n=1 Tax=Tautonia sp. JC769 TaxID=3232135 RepID=UPI00345AC8DE